MQCPVLLAFRKRLKKRGYTDIHIVRCDKPENAVDDGEYYRVTAVEPLAGEKISKVVNVIQFHYMIR